MGQFSILFAPLNMTYTLTFNHLHARIGSLLLAFNLCDQQETGSVLTLLKSSVDVRIGQHRLLPWPLRRAAAGIPRRGRGCRGIRTCCYRGRPLYSGPSSSSSFLSTTLLCNMVGPCCCAMGPCCCARGPTCACPIRVLPGDTRPPRRILKGSRSSSVWLASSLMLFIWLTFDNRRS